jgi:2,5-diketo-D-gluconate reductase A
MAKVAWSLLACAALLGGARGAETERAELRLRLGAGRAAAAPRAPCLPLRQAEGSPGAGSACQPWVSFGTGSSTSRLAHDVIGNLTAQWLLAGGRGLDTAFVYKDESDVGRALRSSALGRGEVFVTTKVPCEGYASARAAAAANLAQLGLGSVDLLLSHWPNATEQLNGTWAALREEWLAGRARHIGVSNFQVDDLKRLMALFPQGPIPAVNQIRMSAGEMPAPELLAYCRDHGIALEAYNPLGRNATLLKNDLVAEIARRHGRSRAQVALRYLTQRGFLVATTATKLDHMLEDLEALEFDLGADDLGRLDALSRAPPAVTL